MPVQHFILMINRLTGESKQTSFGTKYHKAVVVYLELEESYRDQPQMDVVLVGSDSIETIRVTHSTYFTDVPSGLNAVLFRVGVDSNHTLATSLPVLSQVG